MKTLFIIFFISVFVIFVFSYQRMINIKSRRLSGREELIPERFYALYYGDSGLPKEIVIRLLKDIPVRTELPASKLRPQDRFDRELSPVKGWEYDDGLVLLSEETRNLFEKNGLKKDLKSIKTVDDYIRSVASVIAKYK